ncbi:recombinase family protein [Marinibaculum pumilum]|uniref:Recombinase family protein n=1 Tax=Marinibaculum pumilum TaxID=1766165 RepID=A0ABV7L442_9PROT
MTNTAAIYLRVSTNEQTTQNQREALQAVAEKAGWEVAEVYEDAGISGAKARDKRPALDRLMKDAARRRFDVVMAWSVDRLGRSLTDLVGLFEDLKASQVDLYLHQQALDTSTPSGKAMFQMCGVFAEFERSMIQERVKAGLERARKSGTRLGRPSVGDTVEEAIRERLEAGMGKRKIADELGVGKGTVVRVARAQAA